VVDDWWLPLALVVLPMLGIYMYVSRKHLLVFVERYQSLPQRSWILRADPDPLVERWRRRRLLVTGIVLTLIAIQFLSIIT